MTRVHIQALAALSGLCHGLDNGLGLTPPMGYNTWNDLGCEDLNETNVKAVADQIVSSGLSRAGYEYLNLDDCWMAPSRDRAGCLQGDPKRFPSGMKSLGKYLHSKGLKFGIYSDRGSKTCQGLPGSFGSEALDAQTFADWGVDFLKEDNCYSSSGPDDLDRLFKEFGTMRDALNKTGRPIFFSVCGGGDHGPGDNITYYATDPRGGTTLANSWRISSDVIEWGTCQLAFNFDNGLDKFAGKGGYNDPDMLLGSSKSWQMNKVRSRTQFNVLAVLMAPLFIGADLRHLSPYDLETYSNARVIAVNQDLLSHQGKRVVYIEGPYSAVARANQSLSIWARGLSGGKLAMVFVNNYDAAKAIVCSHACWNEVSVKLNTKFTVQDLWSDAPPRAPVAIAGVDYSVDMPVGGGASNMLVFVPETTLLV